MKRRLPLLSCLLVVAMLVGGTWWSVSRRMEQNVLKRKLATAALHGDARQMLALVQAGADPNTPLANGPDPTFSSVLLQWLRPAPVPVLDPHNPNAFVTACGLHFQLMEHGQLRKVQCPEDASLIQTMLAHGANLHWLSRDNQTPLSIAVSSNYLRATELLLDKGADANAPDTHGDTPLIRAVARGERDIVRVLLAHGANVNAQNTPGETALEEAIIMTRDRDTIQQLLAHGANPNLPDKKGRTPLQLAQREKRPDLLLLLQHGAKVNAQNTSG